MRAITLPREHGAYLTLAAVALTAGRLGPNGGAALGAALVVSAAFFLRAPIERIDGGHPLRRWDLPAMVLLAALAALGASAATAARPEAGIGLAIAAGGLVAGSLLARRGRCARGARFETVAMGALGASAGVAAWCGGSAPSAAVAIAAVLGAHAAASVPLVRARVHRRHAPGRPLLAAAALVAAGVAVAAAAGHLQAAFALTPRAADLAASSLRGLRHAHPRTIGWRETGLLAAVVALLLVTMG